MSTFEESTLFLKYPTRMGNKVGRLGTVRREIVGGEGFASTVVSLCKPRNQDFGRLVKHAECENIGYTFFEAIKAICLRSSLSRLHKLWKNIGNRLSSHILFPLLFIVKDANLTKI